MMSKTLLAVVLVSFAVTAQAHSLHSSLSPVLNHNVINSNVNREKRLVEVPSLGALILKGAKAIIFLIKSAWSLVGLKFGVILLAANLIIWGFKHGLTIVLGGVGMWGFCKLTGKCNLESIPKPVLHVGDTLLYAARQLQNGANLYENEVF